MLNRWTRYLPITDFLDVAKPKKILEVGSGSYGLAEFSHRGIIGCDICFPGVILPNLTPVSASCLALPFSAGAFDLVISMDMLEHISERDRPTVIKELVRVSSKHIVIGFPCGKRARVWDFRLLRFCKRLNMNIPDWLTEHSHIEFPEEQEISDVLNKLGLQYIIRRNENMEVHFLIMIGEMFRFTRRIFQILLTHQGFSCLVLHRLHFGKTYRTIFFISK
jgi:SAM-dependent methyltransferase